jgi:hypothetical protein
VGIAVIAVSAITLLLFLGTIITPYSIVFAKKHSKEVITTATIKNKRTIQAMVATLRKTNPLIQEISLLLQMEICHHHRLYRHFYQSIHQLLK